MRLVGNCARDGGMVGVVQSEGDVWFVRLGVVCGARRWKRGGSCVVGG